MAVRKEEEVGGESLVCGSFEFCAYRWSLRESNVMLTTVLVFFNDQLERT